MYKIKLTILYGAVLSAIISTTGCVTSHESLKDPTFDLDTSQTIGLVSFWWTREGRTRETHQLREKQILAQCKSELKKRGFSVVYIPKENLKQTDLGEVHCHGLTDYPDLTLTIGYAVHNTVEYVHSTELVVNVNLWAKPPEYMHMVWQGSISGESFQSNFTEQSETLVKNLFQEEFPLPVIHDR